MTIHPARIAALNDAAVRDGGRYVLLWVQQSGREPVNHALEHAVELGNELKLPVLAAFGLTDGYPEANARHYAFMLEGLAEMAGALAKRGIGFALRKGAPDRVIVALAKQAAAVVVDHGYARIQREWRAAVAARADCTVIEVEGDVVVPVATASPKHEYAARTLRPKVTRLVDDFLAPVRRRPVRHRADGVDVASDLDLGDIPALVRGLKVDHRVKPVKRFTGGHAQAKRRLDAFLAEPFGRYAAERNRPESGVASQLSPYLHFGQISPVEIALRVRERRGHTDSRTSYLEELIVRRELAMNHMAYAPDYDRYTSLPEWARKTLAEHAHDKRPFLYDRDALEAADTHDPHWNAAMVEMRETGWMHNHMRMYWGKKILEWTRSPEHAFETALALNNRYFLDGRDANSFTNVGWLFGLHDRPWFRRPVFGTVRYMGANTLTKFDADGYIRDVERLVAAEAA